MGGRRTIAAGLSGLVGLSGLLLAASAEGASVQDLVPLVRSDGIYVSFRVAEAFDEEIEQAIRTGLEVTFRYNVELKRVRGVWLDAAVSRREIRTMVSYDNLTKRYRLTREIDGKTDATEMVAEPEAMMRFMTEVGPMRMFDLSELESNENYYVRVRGVMRERNLLLLIPWDVGTGWTETHFSYLP